MKFANTEMTTNHGQTGVSLKTAQGKYKYKLLKGRLVCEKSKHKIQITNYFLND